MQHPLQCQCGTIKGFVGDPHSANRVMCYCNDCQAFAHFLGRQSAILDERGGSDVIQTAPKNLTFTQGIEALACMRLTEKGLLRWYADCCKTPIGNTLGNYKLSFIGLVHSCLEIPGTSLQDSFGAIRGTVNTRGAKGNPKPKAAGTKSMILWFVTTTLWARINGSYKHTPFFFVDKGVPIVSPRVLSSEERARLMKAVQASAQ